MDDLMHFLRKNAKLLPDFEMLMPLSWLGVRQFFIDNLQKETHREKIISKEKFEALCVAHNVSEATRPLLFKYLHHSGFLYYHEYLGDKIIADQSWALEAIYQPLKREADHYAEFRDQWKGKIWLNRLFQVFGAGYSPDEKKLFLSFMESCGLCFRMNKESEDAYDPKAVYIFPEFLPPDKPQRLVYEWEQKAKEVRVLRYPMRWNNYFLVRSFITALGRKTSTDHIWRNGIHVSTPEGWFKVELDRAAKSILLYIEASAMPAWLEAILEELRKDREHASWEISSDYGNTYRPFDLEKWKQTRREKIAPSHAEMTEGTHPSDPLPKRLPDVPQVDERQVILFLAANPTDSQLSFGNEFLLIYHKLQEHTNRFLLFTEMGISADRMNEAISSKSPTIIHFVGHGKVQNPDTKKGGGLILHSEDYQGGKEVDAEKLEKNV
ncbi:MAG: hypothetical protein IPI11_11940 [Haliscomenobacter sp.]|nr:hypothetical protein [Haliscomenobacter sp.]